MICCKCSTRDVPEDNGTKSPLCRQCRAEMILCGDQEKLGVMDRAYADQAIGQPTPVTWEELQLLQPAHPFEDRKIRCSVCGASESYDPMKKRQGWPCDRCHRHALACCAKMVVREYKVVSLCRLCCAELELSGESIEKASEPLPGTKDQAVQP